MLRRRDVWRAAWCERCKASGAAVMAGQGGSQGQQAAGQRGRIDDGSGRASGPAGRRAGDPGQQLRQQASGPAWPDRRRQQEQGQRCGSSGNRQPGRTMAAGRRRFLGARARTGQRARPGQQGGQHSRRAGDPGRRAGSAAGRAFPDALRVCACGPRCVAGSRRSPRTREQISHMRRLPLKKIF